MATRTTRTKPLVDRMCEPDLVFGVELRRHKESRCGLYRNIEDMSAAVQYMKDLKKLYPDLEEEIWSIPPSAWILVYKMRVPEQKEKVLQIIITYLRTNEIPIPLYDRDERYSLCIEDVKEIIRYVKGRPLARSYRRSLIIYPDDVALLKKIVKIAIADTRQAGNNADIDRIIALQNKILGPKGVVT